MVEQNECHHSIHNIKLHMKVCFKVISMTKKYRTFSMEGAKKKFLLSQNDPHVMKRTNIQ
jgi:hypothetical protein